MSDTRLTKNINEMPVFRKFNCVIVNVTPSDTQSDNPQ